MQYEVTKITLWSKTLVSCFPFLAKDTKHGLQVFLPILTSSKICTQEEVSKVKGSHFSLQAEATRSPAAPLLLLRLRHPSITPEREEEGFSELPSSSLIKSYHHHRHLTLAKERKIESRTTPDCEGRKENKRTSSHIIMQYPDQTDFGATDDPIWIDKAWLDTVVVVGLTCFVLCLMHLSKVCMVPMWMYTLALDRHPLSVLKTVSIRMNESSKRRSFHPYIFYPPPTHY